METYWLRLAPVRAAVPIIIFITGYGTDTDQNYIRSKSLAVYYLYYPVNKCNEIFSEDLT
jgi:hypothetical protein